MDFLIYLADAGRRCLVALGACLLVGSWLERRHRTVPLELFDAGLAVVFAAVMAWLVLQIARPRWRPCGIRRVAKVPAPTTSGVDLVWDAILLAIGGLCSTTGDVLWRGFLAVPASLVGLRVAYWKVRPTAPGA